MTEYEHACNYYAALEEQAVDGVFTGSTTAVFNTLHISNQYQPKLLRALITLGCVDRVQRGNSHHPSILHLHGMVSMEDYTTKYHSSTVYPRLTKRQTVDILSRRLDIIERRLPPIDLTAYVATLETRLTELEARLAELERDKGGNDFASSPEEQHTSNG